MEPENQIVDLQRIRGCDLDALLGEETIEWRERLNWDFSITSRLVREYIDAGTLGGFALFNNAVAAGYGYCVAERNAGFIGDLYVRPSARNGDAEALLLTALLDGLIARPRVWRVEGQLPFLSRAAAKSVERERGVTLYERSLMTLDFENACALPPLNRSLRFTIEPWTDRFQESAAALISCAYDGHVDTYINEQYQSTEGVRRVLLNILRSPACGFLESASFAAVDAETAPAGIILTSLVAPDTGHISELCVRAGARGAGLGYELLRQALAALQRHGAQRANLTVTSSNTDAIRLYERCGFRETRRFFACVWDALRDLDAPSRARCAYSV